MNIRRLHEGDEGAAVGESLYGVSESPARNWRRRARPRSRSQTGRGAPSAEGVSLRRRARDDPSWRAVE